MDQLRGITCGAARLPVAGHAALRPPLAHLCQRALHCACIGRITQHIGHVSAAGRALAQLVAPPQRIGNGVAVLWQFRSEPDPVRQDVFRVVFGQQV